MPTRKYPGFRGKAAGTGAKAAAGSALPITTSFSRASPSAAKRSAARIANHSIAPAKGSRLRAKLPRRQQIPKLALAANHHRNAGKAGGRNQSEVRIEIEGMRNLDMLPPQTTAKPQASAPRLQSVEVLSEPELWDLAKIPGEGTRALNAAQVNLKLFGPKVLRQHGELALRSPGLEIIGHQKQADGRRVEKRRFQAVLGAGRIFFRTVFRTLLRTLYCAFFRIMQGTQFHQPFSRSFRGWSNGQRRRCQRRGKHGLRSRASHERLGE